jgi:hypothetical protein
MLLYKNLSTKTQQGYPNNKNKELKYQESHRQQTAETYKTRVIKIQVK